MSDYHLFFLFIIFSSLSVRLPNFHIQHTAESYLNPIIYFQRSFLIPFYLLSYLISFPSSLWGSSFFILHGAESYLNPIIYLQWCFLIPFHLLSYLLSFTPSLWGSLVFLFYMQPSPVLNPTISSVSLFYFFSSFVFQLCYQYGFDECHFPPLRSRKNRKPHGKSDMYTVRHTFI